MKTGVITIDKSYVHAESQVGRSKIKVIEVKHILPQIGRFRTVIQVWINWWQANYAQILKRYRRGVVSSFKVICQPLIIDGVKLLQKAKPTKLSFRAGDLWKNIVPGAV